MSASRGTHRPGAVGWGAVGWGAVGWGVVGAGWVARDFVLPAIDADPDARLVAVCDRDPAALTNLPALTDLRGPDHAADILLTTDLDELLTRPGLDAVYVATPNHAHAPVVRAVAEAGVPVLCEKPLAHDVAGARAIVAATADLLAGTAFDQRFHPAHERMAATIAEGALGIVTCVRIVYGCWLPPDWVSPSIRCARTDNWRVDSARAGGGAMIDLAPHGVDLAGYLLGEDLTRLTALTTRRVHDYPDAAADDAAVLAGATDAGVLFTQHVSFSTAAPLPRRRLEVVGTSGQLVAVDTLGQTAGGTLTRIDAATGRAADVDFDAGTGPFVRQLAAFGAAVRGEQPWPYPVTRDLALHELLLGALADPADPAPTRLEAACP